MKTRRIYSVTLSDESRLEKLAQVSGSPIKLIIAGTVLALVLMASGALIVRFTPARYLLPGYLKDSERAATEEQHMRLDSLQQVYEDNQAYLANVMRIINPDDIGEPYVYPTPAVSTDVPVQPDSLLPTSTEELRFLSMMREREKYNISVIAPLAAESMMFMPLSEQSVITRESRGREKAQVILGKGSPVGAIADGTVIAVSQSLRDGGGSAVIIQHSKGFLSRCSRLGTVIVEPGDYVAAGQVIALPASANARNNELVTVEMWHNGTPLLPNDYIGTDPDHLAGRHIIGGGRGGTTM